MTTTTWKDELENQNEVLVIAGRPAETKLASTTSAAAAVALTSDQLLQVPLPSWGRLDEECGWREFATSAHDFANRVAVFGPAAVLGVDWHALGVWRGLHERLGTAFVAAPFIYLNYS